MLAAHNNFEYDGILGPPNMVRAACLQNETAPKSLILKTKNGPKNDPKLPRKILSFVLLCRISHRHFFRIFHREFPRKIKYFFSRRESAGMATLSVKFRAWSVSPQELLCSLLSANKGDSLHRMTRK